MEEPVRIAEDSDFASLKRLVDEDDGWTLELSKSNTVVWTRTVPGCSFQMVKINSRFEDIEPECMYDVLLDPEYRRVWDSHMLESYDIGNLNVNNDIGYYASRYRNGGLARSVGHLPFEKKRRKYVFVDVTVSCPPPMKPRDFVLLRSWLDTGPHGEQMLLSRSVIHKDYPPKKGFVR